MKPIKFPEADITFGKGQPEYEPLPACKVLSTLPDGEIRDLGEVVTCWELSPDEIEKVRQTGCIWLSQLTFNNPMQPVFMTVDKSALFYDETERQSIEASPQQSD